MSALFLSDKTRKLLSKGSGNSNKRTHFYVKFLFVSGAHD